MLGIAWLLSTASFEGMYNHIYFSMKHAYTLMGGLLCLLLSSNANAQMQSRFHYKITNRYALRYVREYKTTLPSTPDSLKTTRVQVETRKIHGSHLKANLKQKGDSLLVDFWAITSNGTGRPDPNTYVTSADSVGEHKTKNLATGSRTIRNYYYYIPLKRRELMSQPVSYLIMPYAAWEIGIATVPFKYRFGRPNEQVSNQFLSNINAGVYVGRKWGQTLFYADQSRSRNRASFTTALMASPTVISIDSANTRGDRVRRASDEMGISVAVGGLISYRDVNAGLFIGLDNPITGQSQRWVYAHKPWIGFGIGFKLAILSGKE